MRLRTSEQKTSRYDFAKAVVLVASILASCHARLPPRGPEVVSIPTVCDESKSERLPSRPRESSIDSHGQVTFREGVNELLEGDTLFSAPLELDTGAKGFLRLSIEKIDSTGVTLKAESEILMSESLNSLRVRYGEALEIPSPIKMTVKAEKSSTPGAAVLDISYEWPP